MCIRFSLPLLGRLQTKVLHGFHTHTYKHTYTCTYITHTYLHTRTYIHTYIHTQVGATMGKTNWSVDSVRPPTSGRTVNSGRVVVTVGSSPGGGDLVSTLPGCVCRKMKDIGPFSASSE